MYKCKGEEVKVVKRESIFAPMLEMLQFLCPNEGCEVISNSSTIKLHLKECGFSRMECQLCKRQVVRSQLKHHQQSCQPNQDLNSRCREEELVKHFRTKEHAWSQELQESKQKLHLAREEIHRLRYQLAEQSASHSTQVDNLKQKLQQVEEKGNTFKASIYLLKNELDKVNNHFRAAKEKESILLKNNEQLERLQALCQDEKTRLQQDQSRYKQIILEHQSRIQSMWEQISRLKLIASQLEQNNSQLKQYCQMAPQSLEEIKALQSQITLLLQENESLNQLILEAKLQQNKASQFYNYRDYSKETEIRHLKESFARLQKVRDENPEKPLFKAENDNQPENRYSISSRDSVLRKSNNAWNEEDVGFINTTRLWILTLSNQSSDSPQLRITNVRNQEGESNPFRGNITNPYSLD